MIAANWTPNCCQLAVVSTDRDNRQADGQTDGQTDRQAGRLADRQTGRLADRQAGRQSSSLKAACRVSYAVAVLVCVCHFVSLLMQLECSQCSKSSLAYIACAVMQCPCNHAGACKPRMSWLLDPSLYNFGPELISCTALFTTIETLPSSHPMPCSCVNCQNRFPLKHSANILHNGCKTADQNTLQITPLVSTVMHVT